jgi:hypothetical protein
MRRDMSAPEEKSIRVEKWKSKGNKESGKMNEWKSGVVKAGQGERLRSCVG